MVRWHNPLILGFIFLLVILPSLRAQNFGPQLSSRNDLGNIEGPPLPGDLSRECLCPLYYLPVCTTEGNTFTNECFARCAKEEPWVTCTCQEVADGTCPRSFKIENLPDKLELQEKAGDVIAVVTENELGTLQGGTIDTSEGERYTVLKMVDSATDIREGYSTYGAFFEQVIDDSYNADELTVEYPNQQLFADVFLVTE